MIQLTRLNNSAIVLNAELIKLVESAPDTVITLVSGEKIVVRESADEVTRRVIEFLRQINRRDVAPSEPHPVQDLTPPAEKQT